MSTKRWMAVFALTLFLSSCEKIIFKKKGDSTNARENFDYLWEQMDKRYAYFSYKGVDWNAMRTKYSPRVYDGMSEDSLFNVMGAMLDELRDGHTNLISPFNISVFDIDLLGPENIDERVVLENYLGTDRTITGPFQHNFLKNKQVGYVRFPSFPGSVDDVQLDYILDKYKDTKGLIFDIRQNGGGAIFDAYSILSRFISKQEFVYTSRGKVGEGHNDFGELKESRLSPSQSIRYTKKVVVLTDRGTYSSGSFFSLMAKAIDNMVVIGDTTGGGFGLPNGGQLPNGWTYRFSITQTLDIFGNNFENGLPPDKRVLVNNANLQLGIDDVIEAAINEIL
ncbi:MAG: S41 family peptidase [Chitinophagales bacterium]|nr:S41 family peptidase [Chitinophagaceae bacterium]MCB9064541.1 S41 family peptidase [Chitinophagales bacterium]